MRRDYKEKRQGPVDGILWLVLFHSIGGLRVRWNDIKPPDMLTKWFTCPGVGE